MSGLEPINNTSQMAVVALQTLLAHRMVSVIQALMRGVIVRKWFRASLMEASSRISDRVYFKRLAAIGCSSGSAGPGGDKLDILGKQVSAFVCWSGLHPAPLQQELYLDCACR